MSGVEQGELGLLVINGVEQLVGAVLHLFEHLSKIAHIVARQDEGTLEPEARMYFSMFALLSKCGTLVRWPLVSSVTW